MGEHLCTSADTDIKHQELWASLCLVANIGNQDQGEPLHGGVRGQGAGVLHEDGGGQRDDGDIDTDMIYLPVQTDRDNERRCHRDIEHQEGVLGGGEGGGADEQPVGDDGRETVQGQGGGHGLLVVTGKRRGRPRKNIVPDGLVQLRIQNFVKIITKNQIQSSGRGGGGQPSGGGGGGGISDFSTSRGKKRKCEDGRHEPGQS